MRKLIVFNNISIDGFIADLDGDMSWAQKQDPEWSEFLTNNAKGEAVFVFGRVTYDLMSSFWPTPMAVEMMPEVAASMNNSQKIVFSRTLESATWQNTMLIKEDIVEAMRELKVQSGPDMIIFGSGTIVSQFAEAGLIDEYQLILNPVILGSGRSMFSSLSHPIPVTRTQTRTFGNGDVLLTYNPKS